MDADVLEELYRKYYRNVVLYCIGLCGTQQLAEDIAADAFVKAYLSLPNDVTSFRYWLMKVCKNLWIDYLRKHRREVSDEYLPEISDGTTPETTYILNERNRCLWDVINTLPAPDREMLILHYFSGLTLQEISQLTGRTAPAVRTRMMRLRQTLKHKMEEFGYGI